MLKKFEIYAAQEWIRQNWRKLAWGGALACLALFTSYLGLCVWKLFDNLRELIPFIGEKPPEWFVANLYDQDIWTLVVIPLIVGGAMLQVEKRTHFVFWRYAAVLCYAVAQVTAVLCLFHRPSYNVELKFQTFGLAWVMWLISYWTKAKGSVWMCIIAHISWVATMLLGVLHNNPEILQIGKDVSLEHVIDRMSMRDIRDLVMCALGTMLLAIGFEVKTKANCLRYLEVFWYAVAQTLAIICTFYWNGASLCMVFFAICAVSFCLIHKNVRGAVPMFIITFIGCMAVIVLNVFNGMPPEMYEMVKRMIF